MLPFVLEKSLYLLKDFLSAVYAAFQRDFAKSRPSYEGRTVVINTAVEYGKEKGFWNLVQRGVTTADERFPDLRRCERVPWAKAIIENSADSAISVWKKPAKRGRKRVILWLESFDYLVILEKRSRAFFLVTAYCTDIESHRRKLRKERDKYLRQQESP